MTTNTIQPSLTEEPTPDSLATPALENLLWRLKARRSELASALALSIDPDLPLPPSTMMPLAAIEGAIQATRAELALEALHGRGGQVAGGPLDVGSAAPVVAAAE